MNLDTNLLNAALPQIQLTKLEYNEKEGTIDVEIAESSELNEYVGKEKKLGRAASHEETTLFFAEIIGKAIGGEDGFALQGINDAESPCNSDNDGGRKI